MYKHMSGVIKETPEKRFISQADKDKYDNYTFMKKSNTYTREEVDKVANTLVPTKLTYSSTSKIVCKNSTKGFIQDFELEGNTFQSSVDLNAIQHFGDVDGDGYSVKLKSVGKNLFDIDMFYDAIKHIKGVSRTERGIKIDASSMTYVCSNIRDLGPITNIPIDPTKKYVIRQVTRNDGVLCARIRFLYTNPNATHGDYVTNGNCFINSAAGEEITGYSIGWNTQIEGGYTTIEDVAVYEVEERVSTFPVYVPFKAQECKINIPMQLKKVGDVADSVIVKDNRVKLIQRIGKKDLSSNVTYTGVVAKYDNTTKACVIINSDATYMDRYWGYRCVSNILNYGHGTNIDNDPNFDREHILVERHANLKYAVMFISNSKIDKYTGLSSIYEQVRAYLKDSGAYVYYILDKPIEHDLGTVDSLLSHNEYTTVFVESNDLKSSKLTCEIPSNIGDSIYTANQEVENIRNKVNDIKNITSTNSLKQTLNSNEVYETNVGYAEDFEIRGKTKYNLASFFTESSISGTISNRDITIVDQTPHSIHILANETFNLSDHSHNGYGFVLFKGLTTKELKPKTKYRVSLDFHSNHQFDKQPVIVFKKNDGAVVNSTSAHDTSTSIGRLSVVIKTFDEISDIACPLFIGFDKATFKKGQRLIVENISIFEIDDDEDINIDNIDNSTMVSTGNTITIRNNSSNIIDFSNAVGVKLDRIANFIKDGLEVVFDSKDSCIVHNTLTTTENNDLFFALDHRYNYLGDFVNKMYYELSWDCEVLEGDPTLLSHNDLAVMPLVTTSKSVTGAFRAVGDVQYTPYINNKLIFNANLVKNSNLLFRINVNRSGYKVRFFNIRLTPTGEYDRNKALAKLYTKDVNKESNEVTIDLSKYGIEGGLKSLPNGVCDRIYKRDGKYYLEQNVGTIVLDGTKLYNILDQNSPQRIRGWANCGGFFRKGSPSYNSKMMYSGTSIGISDASGMPNDEGTNVTHSEFLCVDHNSNIVISLPKTIAPTVEDYKNYFANNPITVYGELLEKKIIELDEHLDLLSYDGINTLAVKTDNLHPVVTYRKPGNINNTVNILTDKIKRLQDNNKKIDLLMLKSIYNGDMSNLELNLMYNTRSINVIDYDLYNLLNKVIDSRMITGENIENMIDFFFMIDKLSMDMVEELYAKIEYTL